VFCLQQRALIEQQEMRRQQKEQAEKERLRVENEKRREREEEEALEKSRYDINMLICLLYFWHI